MLYSIRHSTWENARLPLLLVYLGYDQKMEYTRHPGGSGFFQWYYCISGRAECMIGESRILLHKDQCAMLLPDTAYTLRPLTDDCRMHLIGFTGKSCLDILRVLDMADSGIFQVADTSLIPEATKALLALHEVNSPQKEYAKFLFGVAVDLSTNLKKIPESRPDSPENENIRLVLEYLETRFAEPISLDMLSDATGLTKEYLCSRFKKETGHTILHYLTLTRIGKARLYLEQYPDKTVYEIGRMCGFESPAYFGKKFREITGCTPESYRRTSSILV